MSNNFAYIQAALEHGCHLSPRLEYLSAVNTLQMQALKYELIPFDAAVYAEAEQSNLAAVDHIVDHLVESVTVTAHFEADAESVGHSERTLNVFKIGSFGINGYDSGYYQNYRS